MIIRRSRKNSLLRITVRHHTAYNLMSKWDHRDNFLCTVHNYEYESMKDDYILTYHCMQDRIICVDFDSGKK